MTDNAIDESSGASGSSPARISGFWRRVFAYMIDGLLLAAVGVAIAIPFYAQLVTLGVAGRLIGFPIALLYFGALNSSWGDGRTLGKRLLGLRVVSRRGTTIGFARSTFRSAVFFTPYYLNGATFAPDFFGNTPADAVNAVLAFLVVGCGISIAYLYLFNVRTRQSLHDLAAGTFVVRSRPADAQIAARIAPIHLVIVAVLLGVSAAAPYLAGRYGLPFLSQSSRGSVLEAAGDLQDQLRRDPRFAKVSVQVGSFSSTSGSSTFLTVNVLVKDPFPDYVALERSIAKEVLRIAPDLLGRDRLTVVVGSGFDIGIVYYSVSQSDGGSKAEWQKKLADDGRQI